MRIRFIVLASLLIVSFDANAQNNPSQATGKRSLLDVKLDSVFSSFSKTTPGIAVTIIENGKVLAKRSYGMASLEHGAPFSHNSVVRLPYSEGREFITISAALMEQKGILKLTDPVRKYFPKLPDWSATVTVEDLIHHRSGFADEWDALLLMMASMSNRVDKSQFLNLLYRQPKPEVEPGRGYMYSNSDYGLLRLILEEASNENLRLWMHRELFTPLGMSHTLLHDDQNEVIPNYALQYEPTGNSEFRSWTTDKTSPGGNYFIATTANDLEKWAAAHSDKSSKVSSAVSRLLMHARPMPGAETNYPFGIKLRKVNNHEAILHHGVSSRTFLSQIPDKSISIISVGNYYIPYEPFHREIWQMLGIPADPPFVNKKLSKMAVSYTFRDWQKIVGRYYSADTLSFESNVSIRKKTIQIVFEKDTLKLIDGSFVLPLEHFAKYVFKNPYAEVYLEFGDEGKRFIVHAPSVNQVYTFLKDPTPPWTPSKEE